MLKIYSLYSMAKGNLSKKLKVFEDDIKYKKNFNNGSFYHTFSISFMNK